jgi:hypothetical protein
VPGAACLQCGWPWYTAPRAGLVTASHRREFDTRLQAARREQEKREAHALDAQLCSIITDLYPGATCDVIDISAEQVAVTRTYLDEAGSPQVRDGGGFAWADVLPALSGSEEARHLQLADGGDGLGDAAVASLLNNRLPPFPGGRVLVICGPASWQVLDSAATTLAGRPRTSVLRLFAARVATARERLAELAARSPLRQQYQLMTATVDRRTGAVGLRPRQLFPAGAEPGTEASITLWRMPGDAADTTLAIFADAGASSLGADGATAGPLALYSAVLPAEPGATLRAVLDGPGRVRIIEPAGAVPHPGTWAQIRRQIPDRVTTATAPADLVCAMDLAGTRDVVRQRVSLIRDLVQLLGIDYGDEHGLRVGVVTCTDHVFGRGPGKDERAPVTRVLPLCAASKALAWLGKPASAEIGYQPAAPVEDLLNEALTLLAGSRRVGRVPLLVTVAGRRPHPHVQRQDSRLPCPHRFMWQDLVRRLAGQARARCLVVADALPADGAEADEWRQLGRAGQRVLAAATARQLAEDLGLLTGPAEHIPLPLTDESEGVTR